MDFEKNIKYLFIVDNPIMYVVMLLVIDQYKISHDNVVVSSLRKNKLISISDFNQIYFNLSIFEAFQKKYLRRNIVGRKILKSFEKTNTKFHLFIGQVHEQLKPLINSKFCSSYSILEEGQISYWRNRELQFNKVNVFLGFLKKFFIRGPKYHDFYRSDAQKYIGIMPEAFPCIEHSKKIILNNFDFLKKIYKPKLLGVKIIGITCAARRLKRDQWEDMLKKLISSMGKSGVIKIHPSFPSDKQTRKELNLMLERIRGSKNISFCDDDVVLEIEMLYESKVVYGPLSSLERYTENFGSKYLKIELY